ncbi:MAG: sigma-70 family RNA polymerase sigma factor [Pedobacter sp.]|nr:MAG: sigma-70 family RNA polymerase sigma factor [Pedobacter sp.]
MTTTDQELIDMCLKGKDMGYTGLYNKYAKGIYNSISRIVSHTAEAEDILQETFCLIFTDVAKLKEISSFEGWVKRIAINRSISHLRRKKLNFADLGDKEIADDEPPTADDEEIFDCRVEDVRKSIEALPPGYKMIMTLYLFEKMSQKEIGDILGLSHSTVRTQYHRAKNKILLSLKDKSYYE